MELRYDLRHVDIRYTNTGPKGNSSFPEHREIFEGK